MSEVYCCQHNSHCMLASFLALVFSIWWSHHNRYYHHPHHHHHHHDLHHHHHYLHHHHHLTARSSSPLASVFSVVEGMHVFYYFLTNYILVAFELLLFPHTSLVATKISQGPIGKDRTKYCTLLLTATNFTETTVEVQNILTFWTFWTFYI